MFVTITTADTGGEPIENAAIVAEELERWLREVEGFQGFVMLAGAEQALGLSFWTSRELAERHNTTRTEFRERMLSVAGVPIRSVVDYEVAFARFRPDFVASVSA